MFVVLLFSYYIIVIMEYMDDGVNERLINDARAQVLAQGMAGNNGATGSTAYVV